MGLLATATGIMLLVSCSRFMPEPRHDLIAELPENYTLYEDAVPQLRRWWEIFDSRELNELVNNSLAENLSLQQVFARLTQAEMIAHQARAAYWPEITASGDISALRKRISNDDSSTQLENAGNALSSLNALISGAGVESGGVTSDLRSAQTRLQAAEMIADGDPATAVTTVSHSYKLGLASSYEADLWGRVRARRHAARLDYEAAREDAYAAMLSLTGAVVRQWLAIAAAQQELALVEEQMALNHTTLELIELRFKNGMATALDVYQQRQIVAQTESLRPNLEAAMESARMELAVLLGRPPRTDMEIHVDSLPDIVPLPDPGLPAELLARRPDIRAAGMQLQAADWRIAAARADRLPTLKLTAGASYGAEEWELILDNWMANLAASLTGPVFDAGKRKAEVERARAVADERLAAYRQTVLESIKEVENAMMREMRQREYIDSLENERDIARAAQEQALDRYKKGIIDYLPVLSALTQLQTLERRILQAQTALFERRIQLCLALGGDWMKDEQVNPPKID